MQLTPEEFGIVNNSQFLLVKADVIAKVRAECEQLEGEYLAIVNKEGVTLPPFAQPKISRGENYKGLPYLVLDYPAVFDKENILAFRTMFWWGNFFSINLHLQGKYKEQHLEHIRQALLRNKLSGLYISCNSTAWEYHYEEYNYRLVEQMTNEEIETALGQHNFIKLSAKLDLAKYEQLQDFMQDWFGVMVGYVK